FGEAVGVDLLARVGELVDAVHLGADVEEQAAAGVLLANGERGRRRRAGADAAPVDHPADPEAALAAGLGAAVGDISPVPGAAHVDGDAAGHDLDRAVGVGLNGAADD